MVRFSEAQIYLGMAVKPLLRQVAVILLLAVSLDGTAHLGGDYLQALFGTPEAQWQFAFLLAPVPMLLGPVAVLISKIPRPALSRFLGAASWVATIVPAILCVLVSVHAYMD
jgi:hypothetical protein